MHCQRERCQFLLTNSQGKFAMFIMLTLYALSLKVGERIAGSLHSQFEFAPEIAVKIIVEVASKIAFSVNPRHVCIYMGSLWNLYIVCFEPGMA